MAKQNDANLDFLAATVHDLKTFLTAIIVSAELLAEELHPQEKTPLGRLIQSIAPMPVASKKDSTFFLRLAERLV